MFLHHGEEKHVALLKYLVKIQYWILVELTPSTESSPSILEVHHVVPFHDAKTLTNLQVQSIYPLCMSEVQYISPINDGGLEDYVDNNLTLREDEDLIEIT
jgi:hypothetical protein